MRELGNKERCGLEQLECERQRKGEERTRQLERVWKQKEKEGAEQLECDREAKSAQRQENYADLTAWALDFQLRRTKSLTSLPDLEPGRSIDRGPPRITGGLDVLAHKYLVLGAERRERRYAISGEETPPDFPDLFSPLASLSSDLPSPWKKDVGDRANEKHRGGNSERRGRPSKSTQSNGSDEKEGLVPTLTLNHKLLIVALPLCSSPAI
jgi:hypothetical protein